LFLPNAAYLCCLGAGAAEGVNQRINILPGLLPKRALPYGVLLGMAFLAQAYSAPIVRFLPHASAGTEANVRRLNPCIAMAY
jgi:hypothetical protein